MTGWQPIETAPKNGTRIDLGCLSAKCFTRAPDCYWHKKAHRWISKWCGKEGYSALRLPFTPTHWMLPPPPPEPKP